MEWPSVIVLTHLAFTAAMVGFAWTIQVVVYPALGEVPTDRFVESERLHQHRVLRVLAAFAPLEVVTAAALAVIRPDDWLVWVGGGLLAAIWVSTAVFFAPLHGRLTAGFDERVYTSLVTANRYRTWAWTGRLLLALWIAV
jgi:hypothetical protein